MFKFPTMPETTLLNVVAETISKHFPELAKFGEQIPIIEKAAKGETIFPKGIQFVKK